MQGPDVELRRGQTFAFALPRGWQVAEEGPFAVTTLAPDRTAVTVLVGNSGLPVAYPPGQYLWEQLARLQLEGLQLGPPRPAAPVLGFPHAWEHDASYAVRGVPCRGVAKVSAAPAYDTVTLVVTWAAAQADRWPALAGWLPQVASQVQICGPGAFGMAGIAAQNLANSNALGQQLQSHRAWSANLWDQVARERAASQDQIAFHRGQGLAGVQRYDDPVAGRSVDLPASNAVYWVHAATGRIVGSPDPSFDPRTPFDASWTRLPRSG